MKIKLYDGGSVVGEVDVEKPAKVLDIRYLLSQNYVEGCLPKDAGTYILTDEHPVAEQIYVKTTKHILVK